MNFLLALRACSIGGALFVVCDSESLVADAVAVVGFSLVYASGHVDDFGVGEFDIWYGGGFCVGGHVVHFFVVFNEVEKGLFAFQGLSLMVYFVNNGAIAAVEFMVLGDTF